MAHFLAQSVRKIAMNPNTTVRPASEARQAGLNASPPEKASGRARKRSPARINLADFVKFFRLWLMVNFLFTAMRGWRIMVKVR